MRRILTKNGVDNTNIDGARANNFNAGRRSGIVKGALNGGNFFASNNNTIALDTCELRLCGHRIVIDVIEYRTFTNKPSVPVRYSFVARVIVDNNYNVSFEFVAQEATTQLVQDNLDINGSGTYELEIGRFTQLTDGTVTDVVRTADLITGGAGGGDSEYIRIGTVTTNKISPELDADVDIENTINPDDNKPQTNFTFNLPTPSGTVVSLNGVEKTSINTDTIPNANSENLITSGGVHETSIVRYGVDLSDIANSYQSTWDELIKVNGFGKFYTSGATFPSFLPACPDDIWHETNNIVEIGVKIKSNNFTSSMEFVLQGINQNSPAYKLDAYFDGTNWRNSGWYKPRAIELIYDKEIKNTIDGTAYTNGLYTSGLYIKDNIPDDVTRLRIYYANQYVSILDNGGTHNVCELDIRDRNTAWCETCVVNAHKSDADATDDTLFKLLLALDQAGYMNVKFFKNTTKIEDGTSCIYRIEGLK